MIRLLPALALADIPSPHGDPDGCLACHVEGDEDAPVGVPKPATATCLGCHPTADMHPVGVAPVETTIPEGWPLEDGGVSCVTCHVEPAHVEVDDDLPGPWHREGPYARTLGLCARCHALESFERVDPHHAPAERPARDAGCAACHTSLPRAGAPVSESRLRTEPETLCALCHEGEVHHGAGAHLGQGVPATMEWPTWPAGRVACFTCHDVHGGTGATHHDGLSRELEARAGIPTWSADPEHPAMLVLPLSLLCPSCHGVGP